MTHWTTRLVLLLAIACCADWTFAQEWTRFRGPNGSGVSEAQGIPAEWTEADYRWRVELPGVGHSAPVIWGDKVFLTSADNDNATRMAHCLSARDGKLLWSRSYTSSLHTKHQFNSFASSTPAVDEERVYVVWSAPEDYSIRALDHDGQEVWHRSLGPFVSQHSCGTSPIVYENLVILGNDQDESGVSFLVALDRTNGEVVWQTPRPGREVSYATPCVYEPPGRGPELVFLSGAHGFTGIDPKTGARLWELADVFDKRTVSSPVVAGDLVLGTCGSGGGGNFVVAVRPGGPDNQPAPEVAYKITKSAPYVPTPVYLDGHVYLWSDQGVVSSVRSDSGEVVWQHRVGGRYFGSPICVDRRLYCMSDAGECVVVATGPEYQLLGKNPIGEGSHSTPSVAGGVLYLRTFSHLVALGGG
ncbi:MAG: PQQ-like beta-propeller repeat protein [Pirellulales bacterium]|nr:PQQ-like beta-propeller repeat protein [Pirellulales bacterium]